MEYVHFCPLTFFGSVVSPRRQTKNLALQPYLVRTSCNVTLLHPQGEARVGSVAGSARFYRQNFFRHNNQKHTVKMSSAVFTADNCVRWLCLLAVFCRFQNPSVNIVLASVLQALLLQRNLWIRGSCCKGPRCLWRRFYHITPPPPKNRLYLCLSLTVLMDTLTKAFLLILPAIISFVKV